MCSGFTRKLSLPTSPTKGLEGRLSGRRDQDLPVQVESSKDLLQLHDFARGEALADLADDLTFKSWSHFTQNVMIWDV
jgi:hypothetical protein